MGQILKMRQSIKDQYWPFSFGMKIEEIKNNKLYQYDPMELLNAHPNIEKALFSLKDGTFANTDMEHSCFCDLYESLVSSSYGGKADRYLVVKRSSGLL